MANTEAHEHHFPYISYNPLLTDLLPPLLMRTRSGESGTYLALRDENTTKYYKVHLKMAGTRMEREEAAPMTWN